MNESKTVQTSLRNSQGTKEASKNQCNYVSIILIHNCIFDLFKDGSYSFKKYKIIFFSLQISKKETRKINFKKVKQSKVLEYISTMNFVLFMEIT